MKSHEGTKTRRKHEENKQNSLVSSSFFRAFVALCIFFGCAKTFAADAEQGTKILQDLERFRAFGSVLYVAAHPDDENTQLITYLSLGRHYRTAYLSMTRGDGGNQASRTSALMIIFLRSSASNPSPIAL